MINALSDVFVVCELDNGLLNRSGALSECDRTTLNLFTRMGGYFTVVSERTPDSIRALLGGTPLSCPVIACGGAVLYDLQTGEYVDQRFIPEEKARPVLQGIIKRFPEAGVEIFVENCQLYIAQNSRYAQKDLLNEQIGCIIAPLEEIPSNWIKVRLAADPVTIASIQKYLKEQVLEGVGYRSVGAAYYEMLPAHTGRTQQMEKLCGMLDIPVEDTVMIASCDQDIEMMHTAGYSAVLDNASRSAKLEADKVVAGCDFGGVGEYLYSLVKRYT